MIRPWLAAPLCCILALPLGAQTEGWPIEQFDPGAAEKPADLVLPLPCGGAMAFQRVGVPVDATNPLDDRRLRLGQSQPETGYADYLHTEYLRGPFLSETDTFFYIARYELTRGQMRALRGDCAPLSRADRTAAAGLSWFDAVMLSRDYSEWLLTEAPEALPPEAEGAAFLRLPTETEWEYAARGGALVEATVFSARRFFGDGDLAEYAMFQGAARGEVLPVGLRQPNPLGLYDVYGNAEEIMLEPFRLNAVGRPHGQVGGMVTRGGSVLSAADAIYSAQRTEYPLFRPEDGRALAGDTFGMRLVLTRHVTNSDAALRDIRAGWMAAAEAPAAEGADPLLALAALIEEETDPRRQQSLGELQLEFRLARDAAAASARDAAKSTLLGGAVFLGTLANGAEEIDRQTATVRAMVDQIRVSTGDQRTALMSAAERTAAQLETLRGLQRTYLLSYRAALESLVIGADPATLEGAYAILRQELEQSGRGDLLGALAAFNRDLAQFAARPDLGEAELLAIALED